MAEPTLQKVATTNTPPKTPVERGWRSLWQSTLGAVAGLLLAVWNTPGVPETIVNYAQNNFVPLLITFVALIGVPTAVVTFVQNYLETKRKLKR